MVARFRANCAQHTDVVTPFCDNRAEGVEDDKCAHRQREQADHIEYRSRVLHRRGEFRTACQPAQRVRVPQLRFDVVDDGIALRFILGREVRLDDVDTSRRIEQFLRLAERDETCSLPTSARLGSRPTIVNLTTPSVVGTFIVSFSFTPRESASRSEMTATLPSPCFKKRPWVTR